MRQAGIVKPIMRGIWRSIWRGILLCLICFSVFTKTGFAAHSSHDSTHDQGGQPAQPGEGTPSETKADKPEEEDYSSTPFTEFGEFNETGDEEADTKFFQYGRLFGASLGVGFEFIDGYRGALWNGGFPAVDFKFHYWFDFNFALDLGFYTASHYFDSTSPAQLGHYDTNLFSVYLDVKYYFTTTNLSAALSFANPYILLGVGSFTKTQTNPTVGTPDVDTSLGLNAGAGLEFILSPRKTYFEIEAKIHVVSFKDTYTSNFTSMNLPNLTGNFYTVMGSILFTW